MSLTATPGTGVTLAADNVGSASAPASGQLIPYAKFDLGAAGASQPVVGSMPVSAETGTVYNGGTALTPKFAKISASASGVTQVVAAVATKKIRVLSYVLTFSAAVNVKFQSHVTPTDLTGLLYGNTPAPVVSGWSQNGHFETVAGEALDVNLSGAVPVGGHCVYVEV